MNALAPKLEAAVWEETKRYLDSEAMAKLLIEDAKIVHGELIANNEGAVLRQKLIHLKRKLEGLAARLADIPADISPDPIFHLMRKTEAEIKTGNARVLELGNGDGVRTMPAEFGNYLKLIEALRKLDSTDPENKTKIFECLIHQIEITEDGFKIYFYAGEMEIDRARASGSRPR